MCHVDFLIHVQKSGRLIPISVFSVFVCLFVSRYLLVCLWSVVCSAFSSPPLPSTPLPHQQAKQKKALRLERYFERFAINRQIKNHCSAFMDINSTRYDITDEKEQTNTKLKYHSMTKY